MKKIGLDYSKVFNFISNDELNQMKILVDEAAHNYIIKVVQEMIF